MVLIYYLDTNKDKVLFLLHRRATPRRSMSFYLCLFLSNANFDCLFMYINLCLRIKSLESILRRYPKNKLIFLLYKNSRRHIFSRHIYLNINLISYFINIKNLKIIKFYFTNFLKIPYFIIKPFLFTLQEIYV